MWVWLGRLLLVLGLGPLLLKGVFREEGKPLQECHRTCKGRQKARPEQRG